MDKNTEQSKRSRERLIKHYQAYPSLLAQDVFKYAYQSAFGCEHLVSDAERARQSILDEYAALDEAGALLVEPLDGAYSRVHLASLGEGLTPETLAKLFCLSSKKEPNGLLALEQTLAAAQALVLDGTIPLDGEDFANRLSNWRELGYPAMHHSDVFRKVYRPAYRVVANEYAKLLPIFARIDKLLSEQGSAIVAIEGGSASGKTTLAEILSRVYDCNVFHTDDFFLRPEQRSVERLAEVGGNLDRERFCDEILQALKKNETVCYRPFDCATQTLGEPILVKPKRLTVVEGVYSMHPAFGAYCDLSVFLDIAPEYQRERIENRNSPQLAKRFFTEWIPLENEYFLKTDLKRQSDLVLLIEP